MKVVILGATGMLGHVTLRLFAESGGFETVGIVRSPAARRLLPDSVADRVHGGLDAENPDSLAQLFESQAPDVVINCVGLVKQFAGASRVLEAVPINTLLPHRLAGLCKVGGARLVHLSTDCVFTGKAGMYRESDAPDATDLYGVSKLWGEVDEPHAVTLRTSIIGPELQSSHGLLEWFLSQPGRVSGYARAFFSGFPTVELARIIRDHVLAMPDLHGVYHVSAESISKYDLLKLIAAEYGREVEIVPDTRLEIDRSLDSSRFRAVTGYAPPSWPDLIAAMHRFG